MRDRTFFLRKHLRGCQPSTRGNYEWNIRQFVEDLDAQGIPLEKATVDDFDRFVDKREWKSNTEAICLAAIKAYLKATGLNDHPLCSHTVSKQTEKHRARISEKKKDLVLAICDDLSPAMAILNRAIVEVLWSTGIRRLELATALLENLDLEQGYLLVSAKAKNRKGRRPQLKKLSPQAIKALQEWLIVRSQTAHSQSKTIFVSQAGTPLTGDGVACIFKRMSQKLGFNVSPHMFRGGMATHAVNNGVNDRLVMQQGGWESHAVFKIYTEEASLNEFGKLMWGDNEEEDYGNVCVPVG